MQEAWEEAEVSVTPRRNNPYCSLPQEPEADVWRFFVDTWDRQVEAAKTIQVRRLTGGA